MAGLFTGLFMFLLGWFVGVVCAAGAQSNTERKSIKNGVVKLDNEFYYIEKVEKK